MSMIRTRKQENPFVQLDKHFLEDESISFEAKGLLAYILSKPDTWTVRKTDLIKRSASGKTRIESALLELMAAGYLNWYRLREEDGTFGEWVYDVYERPDFNPEAAKCIEEGKNRILERKNKTKKRNSRETPKVDNQLLDDLTVSPKVDYPPLDNPPLDNQPYSNNYFNNNELINNNLEEEEEIASLCSQNGSLKMLKDFLQDNEIKAETVNTIILECNKRNVTEFTLENVQQQYGNILKEINKGKTIYDYAIYFVGGLVKVIEQSALKKKAEKYKPLDAPTNNSVNKPYKNKSGRVEVVPEWFGKSKEERIANSNAAVSVDVDAERERLKKELGVS